MQHFGVFCLGGEILEANARHLGLPAVKAVCPKAHITDPQPGFSYQLAEFRFQGGADAGAAVSGSTAGNVTPLPNRKTNTASSQVRKCR